MPESPKPGRRVTIVDVAQHAGVSTTAVSKVVRNASGASAQMRSRVQAAVDQLGYRPSAAARALRGRTYTLGVVLPDVRNPFFVDHLTALGHRRIAHIEHHETDPVRLAEMPNARRADGYRHAMRVHGLGDQIDIVSTTYNRDGGYVGTRQLLHRPDRPTAIFAGADIVAMGVLDALTEAGLSVPGDISVAGYDNITFAAFGPISLTTVDQAGHRIGGTAARLLLDRITTPGRRTSQVTFSPRLIPRRTTAAPHHFGK